MTSVFSAEGKNIPCTVIEVGPVWCNAGEDIVEVDGYEARAGRFPVDKKEKHTTKPQFCGSLLKGWRCSQEILGLFGQL